jgi:hypothetical protein
MTVVKCSEDLPGSAVVAERLWFDIERWGTFIEGFGAVQRVQGPWPASGGVITWSSTPHGRGVVTERMLEYEPAKRARSEVTDDRLKGTRIVTFSALQDTTDAVHIAVELDYLLKGPLWRHLAIDWLFVRRALRDSMQRELERFAAELQDG